MVPVRDCAQVATATGIQFAKDRDVLDLSTLWRVRGGRRRWRIARSFGGRRNRSAIGVGLMATLLARRVSNGKRLTTFVSGESTAWILSSCHNGIIQTHTCPLADALNVPFRRPLSFAPLRVGKRCVVLGLSLDV